MMGKRSVPTITLSYLFLIWQTPSFFILLELIGVYTLKKAVW